MRPEEPAPEQQAVADVMNAPRAIVRALRLNTRAIERQLGISLAQPWGLQILSDHPSLTLTELAAGAENRAAQ